MKRILSAIAVLFAAMVFAVTASAQKPRVGVLVGFTSSNADVSQFDASSVSLYHAGLAFNFPLGIGFAIQPQLLYQVKGASLDEIHTVQDIGSQSMDLKVGYFELPVQVQWGPDLVAFRPYAFLEPFIVLGVNMTSDYTANGKVLDEVSNAFKDVNMSRFEYGLGLGGGLEIWRLQLSLKYFWNFGSLSSDGHKVDSPIGRTVTEAFKNKKNFNGLTLSAALFF